MSKEIKNRVVPKLRFPEFKNEGEWDCTLLENLCELITKGTTPTTIGFNYIGSGINFIKIESILDGKINLDKVAFISAECNEVLKRSQLKENDILFSIAGALGVITTVSNEILPANTNQALSIVRLRNTSQKDYLKAYLNSNLITSEITKIKAGAAQPNISLNQVGNFKILIPKSSEEQQKIAYCLSSLDDLITAENQQLDALKAHKKGLMQQLFPAEGETVLKLRFAEFMDSGEWEEDLLENLSTKISDGIHSTPVYDESGDYFFINGNNLFEGKIYIDENTKKVTDDEYKKHRRELNQNTILLSINGTIGNIAEYNNEKVILGKSACYINIDISKANKLFIKYFLQTEVVNNYFDGELTGSTIKNLSLKTIKNTLVKFPKTIEQQKIASCLSSLDELITAQAEKIESLKLHKKGLMQGLFPAV